MGKSQKRTQQGVARWPYPIDKKRENCDPKNGNEANIVRHLFSVTYFDVRQGGFDKRETDRWSGEF
jgi:hypothetical protein